MLRCCDELGMKRIGDRSDRVTIATIRSARCCFGGAASKQCR